MPRFNKLPAAMILICAFAFSISAGAIECPVRQASSPPVTTTGDISPSIVAPGEMQAGVTSAGHIDCGLTTIVEGLIRDVLSLC
jgi:hypothetical protein